MAATVVGLNVAGWGMLAAGAPGHHHINKTEFFGFGTGVLAYTLGMRHAFDADHIAAIDNTTRKLISDGQATPERRLLLLARATRRSSSCWPSCLNFGIRALDDQVKNDTLGAAHTDRHHRHVGLGDLPVPHRCANMVVLVSIVKVFREMRQGKYDDEELERQLNSRGPHEPVLRRLARRIDTPWKMYPVGVLFGLGFDTATEVALLVLAGTAVVGGLPFYAILSLPILFAAGMSLFDTIDGCFMNFAYDWAFSKPIRKVYYNLTITGLSVFVAFFIGTIEILGLIGPGDELERRRSGTSSELQHQHGRLRHRRRVRRDLGRGARHLALRPHRAQVGDAGGRGLRQTRTSLRD